MKRYTNKTHRQATHADSCRVFETDLSSLFQLAFLLTGDQEMAESILIAGIEECVGGNPGFSKWARLWARRIIITSAIRLIAPLPWGTDDRYLETDELQARFPEDGPGEAIARRSGWWKPHESCTFRDFCHRANLGQLFGSMFF